MSTPEQMQINAWAERLRRAEASGMPIAPLRTEIPNNETAYAVQLANVRHAVEQAPNSIFIAGADGNIDKYVNPRVHRHDRLQPRGGDWP